MIKLPEDYFHCIIDAYDEANSPWLMSVNSAHVKDNYVFQL